MSTAEPVTRLLTARLELRPIRAEDFEVFYTTLVADPEVMRFYHSYRTLDDVAARRAKARRDFFDHFEEAARQQGYVAWGLWSRPTLAEGPERFIGYCAIANPGLADTTLGPEVQYMLGAQWHGRGLASEAAGAVVDDAFRRHSLPRMHTVADTPNVGSRRVIERLGFTFRGQVEVYGSADMVLYTMERADWDQRRGVVAQTARLRLRRAALEDAGFIYELVTSPPWLRFIGDRGVRDLPTARDYIVKGPLQMYRELGFGLFLVELKDSGEPIGSCGLLKREYLPDVDIGFAFLAAQNGKGYAFEAAQAVMALGCEQHGVKQVFAIVNPDNVASIRLLEKLGFAAAGQVRPPGEERDINLYRWSP